MTSLFREARDVLRQQVLRMFDPEAAIARAVTLRSLGEHVEHVVIAGVADRVHRDVQPGGVGAQDEIPQLLGRRAIQAMVARVVRIGFAEQRRSRAERTVDQPFDAAPAHPVVAATFGLHQRGQFAPVLDRYERVEAHLHAVLCTQTAQRVVCRPVELGHVHLRDAFRKRVRGARDDRLVDVRIAGRRDHALHERAPPCP